MTNLIRENLDKIYKLLSEQKFKLLFKDVSDQYKCGLCKNILINAHQTFCGCNFCYECINQYIDNGAVICPGNTEECKLENNFTNFMTNYGLNKQILKLVINCPNQMCSHECQLIDIGDHLKNCSNKFTNCPFDYVGSVCKSLQSEKINEHLLLEINNHSTLLIDFIKNLKSEVQELKLKEEYNRLEIEKLKENDRKKDEKIKSLQHLIKSIKEENENIVEQMDIGDRNLWNKFDEINIGMKDKSNNDVIQSINDEIKLLKIDKEKLLKEMKSFIDEKFMVSIREEWNEKLRKTLKFINQGKKEPPTNVLSKIYEIDKFLAMRHCGILWWQIGQIDKIGSIWSECFYDKRQPYKMKLQLEKDFNNLNFVLIIHSGEFDEDLHWPCNANITILIYALNDYRIKESLRGTCVISKPQIGFEERSKPIILPESDIKFFRFAPQEYALKCFVNIS